MATNFPTSLDSFTNPTAADNLDTAVGGRTHDQQHADLNDAVEATGLTTTSPATLGTQTQTSPMFWVAVS